MIAFPTAYPSLNLIGDFRTSPEDFIVNEHLGFEPSGDGEHALIYIEKTGQNTHWVAEQLAELLGLDKKAVGYCGRKDRHAITQQWLSIYDPHRGVDFSCESNPESNKIDIEGVRLLKATRHSHKLRPGDHKANRFCIRLRNIRTVANSMQEQLLDNDQKLYISDEIKRRLALGVPNYFGPQRFGRDGNNLIQAANWFEKKQPPSRKQKSMVMSAARSYLFNKVLAARVEKNCWASAIEGDILLNNIPSAPLWGRGRLASTAKALALEESVLAELADWCHGLEHCGLAQERRATTLAPVSNNLKTDAEFNEGDLILQFELPAGAFATSLLAEIATLQEG